MARRAQWLAVGIILASLSLIGVGATLSSDIHLVGPGSEAPDFEVINVASGDAVTLAEYEGEVVLLNIWATWCRPCEEEMPSMQRLYEALGPAGLKIAAVSIDEASSDKVLDWARERNLTFHILHDRKRRIERLYQTTGVPESFIIDRQGVIVKRQIGAYEWDRPAPVALFRRLLESEDGPRTSQVSPR